MSGKKNLACIIGKITGSRVRVMASGIVSNTKKGRHVLVCVCVCVLVCVFLCVVFLCVVFLCVVSQSRGGVTSKSVPKLNTANKVMKSTFYGFILWFLFF